MYTHNESDERTRRTITRAESSGSEQGSIMSIPWEGHASRHEIVYLCTIGEWCIVLVLGNTDP